MFCNCWLAGEDYLIDNSRGACPGLSKSRNAVLGISHLRMIGILVSREESHEGGLLEFAESWPWSSFRSYAFGETGVVRIKWDVLKLKSCSPMKFGEVVPAVVSPTSRIGAGDMGQSPAIYPLCWIHGYAAGC